MAAGKGASIRFSTALLPERDRVGIWREVLGRSALRLDIEAIASVPFFAEVSIDASDDFAIASVKASGTHERRTRELLADGNSGFGLVINLAGPFLTSHRGRDAVLAEGDGMLLSMAEPGAYMRPVLGQSIALTVSRSALAALVPNADDALGMLLPADRDAVKVLRAYLCAIREIGAPDSSHVQRAMTDHLCDLVALALGAKGEAGEFARGRGLRAGRFAAVKADVRRNLGKRDLALAEIACRHGVTTRYIQRLFEADGATFSEYLLERRLDAAHKMLGNPRWSHWKISSIAFDVGFGDLSYFNRTFRRRYGAPPSDMRR
jgi:AraC-like DNA-binding protein